MVPLINKKTSATQNQAMISRWMRWPTGTAGCDSLLFLASAFMFHRDGTFDRRVVVSLAVHGITCFTVSITFPHFKLHEIRGIHAGVARRAVVSLSVINCLLQPCERNVTK